TTPTDSGARHGERTVAGVSPGEPAGEERPVAEGLKDLLEAGGLPAPGQGGAAHRRAETILQDGFRLAELAPQADRVQLVQERMRHRVAADLHARGGHLAPLRPG